MITVSGCLVIQSALNTETKSRAITAFMEKPRLLKNTLSTAKKTIPGIMKFALCRAVSLSFISFSFMLFVLVLISSYPILAKKEGVAIFLDCNKKLPSSEKFFNL